MDLESFSIVTGPLPLVIVGLGLVSIPASIGWRARSARRRARDGSDAEEQDWSSPSVRRRPAWRRQLFIGIPIAAALVALTATVVDGFALIPYQFPNSYYLWVGLVLLAVVLCILGWLGAPWWRRMLSVLSIALTALMAFTLINKEYGYWPTIGALLGRNAQNQVDSAELKAAQATYRKTRTLPDHGFTISLPVPGTVSGFRARDAYVWLPPAWVAAPTPHLPVVELLHGSPGSPSDWTRAGFADQTGLRYARSHAGIAPIIVMPDSNGSEMNDTECVNSERGNAETYLTIDVPAFARQTFSALGESTPMAIAGESAGGMCALMLALRHPNQYSTFVDLAGLSSPTIDESVDPTATIAGLFGGSAQRYHEHDPLSLLRAGRFPTLAGWFEVGTSDSGPLAAQRTLLPLAIAAGIATCARESPGNHSYTFAAQGFAGAFPWVAHRLSMGAPAPNAAADCPAT